MVYELLPSILDPAPLLPASKPSLSSIDATSEGLHLSTSGSCQEAPISSSVLSSVEEDIPASPPPSDRGELPLLFLFPYIVMIVLILESLVVVQTALANFFCDVTFLCFKITPRLYHLFVFTFISYYS